MLKTFHVYILSSRSRTLYVGWTGDLPARVHDHKTKACEGFTARYNVDRLVYYEEQPKARQAFERERELKNWVRARKIALIEEHNPTWDDLSAGWFDESLERDVR